jgi:hypothetical protein
MFKIFSGRVEGRERPMVLLTHSSEGVKKFGWRRPLRSARLGIAPEDAHLKVCASPLMPDLFTPARAVG